MWMLRFFGIALLVLLSVTGMAQQKRERNVLLGERVLTLDSCRAMALRNNKQMGVAGRKVEMSANLRKSARTQYLPRLNAVGGYVWMNRELSVLSNDQKNALSSVGTTMTAGLQKVFSPITSRMPADIQSTMAQDMAHFAGAVDQMGMGVVDGFRTDTRNVFAGSVTVTQPLFMGGAIVAANKMADINEEMAENSLEAKQQSILFNIDHAYWQVVSLCHKQKLSESYVELVRKLNSDVQKMIEQGVATKGDGLSVGVRLNEAEIALMEIKDGLVLSRMLLCELCGLPVNESIVLADETSEDLLGNVDLGGLSDVSFSTAVMHRPELRLLQNTVDLTRQTTNVLRAGNLPQVMLTGGYSVSNPNMLNGFENKFGGFWNVGVMIRVPVWNWGDVKYKIRASKEATAIANLELDEAREMIELQVNQSKFRVSEAGRKLEMANANIVNAEENLRMADLGFKEGIVSYTTVMEAQTAWQLAQSKKIDAEIGLRLSQVELQKALGVLH